jgi:acyl-CoA dehydrogenase
MVQEQIADSWIQIQQFRLLVMYTAWLIDQSSTAAVLQYVAACKVLAAEVLTDITSRATHLHGALGVSNMMGLTAGGATMGLVDGPTEIHKVTIARQVLKDHSPHPDGWPTMLRPRRLVEARERFDNLVDKRIDDAGVRKDFHGLLQSSEAPDDKVAEMREYLDAVLGNL